MTNEYQSLYMLEYSIIPRFIDSYMRGGKSIDLISDKKRLDAICKMTMADQAKYIDWNNISIDLYGSPESGCIICYTFPKPIQMPLAKFGVAHINTTTNISNYYLLEKSLSDYVMGSTDAEGLHMNFGSRPDMNQAGFIKEVCKMEDIDLPQKTSTGSNGNKESFFQRIKKIFKS